MDQKISLKGYSLLVGPNNSGKSTIIDAIRAFYEENGFKFDPEHDFPANDSNDGESWVDLAFDLTENEWNGLDDKYKESPLKELKLRKYLKIDDRTKSGNIFCYNKDGPSLKFYNAKNSPSGRLGKLIYIPAISTIDDHTKLTGPSPLRELLNGIMSKVVVSGSAYNGLTEAVQRFEESIREERTTEGRSLAEFETELNRLIQPWQAKFSLKFSTPSVSEMTKSMVKFEVTDEAHGRPQEINYFGSGFQRFFIYSLIQLAVRYAGMSSGGVTGGFTPSLYLVLFEEPEAFLHPPQQEQLAVSLKQLGSSDDWQVICTTHSPNFVSKNAEDIPAIVRCTRKNGIVECFQISDSDWHFIVDKNQQIIEIEKRYPKLAKKLKDDATEAEMESLNYFLWLNSDRSAAFFADHVLLVEGPTEVALINKLIADGKIEKPDVGLYVMDCFGKYNIHRFMNLLAHMGIPHSVIHDDDDNKGVNKDINKLIKESRNDDFTLKIEQCRGNLEKLLGISSTASYHRKPQDVLYKYHKGKINKGKLGEFCNLVQNCLPSGR